MVSGPFLPYEPSGLYVLLYKQKKPTEWHWTLYLHQSIGKGIEVHAVTDKNTGRWIIDRRNTDRIVTSGSLIYALKVGIINPDSHEIVAARIAEVPMGDTEEFGKFTCRTWVLRAIQDIQDEGRISIKLFHTIQHIEQEAINGAANATTLDVRTLQKSDHTSA
ncbi:hypothetical protein V494_05323 [Pseudogymnoascus sp. VKM F-4513 (FW-928)]|nr:hypothetical protein V494_05323 [Pseudogymnoascus sp. VKM F-4513 (FW-928)]